MNIYCVTLHSELRDISFQNKIINKYPLSVNLRSTSPALTNQGDMSRQEALKTSVSLLNIPLDMALLGKKRNSKSKSPIRRSLSPNTKLKDDKKNKNDVDEGTSDLANFRVPNKLYVIRQKVADPFVNPNQDYYHNTNQNIMPVSMPHSRLGT